ncbi:MAG: VanZ family protein [Clostridia bacterium]|nr:VanZ family protein [Clostridia bacterium]
MKSWKKASLFTALALLWTAVIFSFSLQPAEASASLSGGLLQRLLDWFYWLTGLSIPTYFAHFLIRKAAHFGEFFLLGILSYQASKHWFGRWYPALLYGAVVAVADEHIQHYTGGGRAMLISDMILDTVGVATAILLLLLLAKISRNKKHKNTKNQ